ncbi:hypothetical protein WN48_08013 [Eufriesea mexicana]|nr:hypothetical protein WN48_08013 [Eufriesea mexicana]
MEISQGIAVPYIDYSRIASEFTSSVISVEQWIHHCDDGYAILIPFVFASPVNKRFNDNSILVMAALSDVLSVVKAGIDNGYSVLHSINVIEYKSSVNKLLDRDLTVAVLSTMLSTVNILRDNVPALHVPGLLWNIHHQ